MYLEQHCPVGPYIWVTRCLYSTRGSCSHLSSTQSEAYHRHAASRLSHTLLHFHFVCLCRYTWNSFVLSIHDEWQIAYTAHGVLSLKYIIGMPLQVHCQALNISTCPTPAVPLYFLGIIRPSMCGTLCSLWWSPPELTATRLCSLVVAAVTFPSNLCSKAWAGVGVEVVCHIYNSCIHKHIPSHHFQGSYVGPLFSRPCCSSKLWKFCTCTAFGACLTESRSSPHFILDHLMPQIA